MNYIGEEAIRPSGDTDEAVTYYTNLRLPERNTAGVRPERHNYGNFCFVPEALLSSGNSYEPFYFEDDIYFPRISDWMEVMREELGLLSEKGVWPLIPLPTGRKEIRTT